MKQMLESVNKTVGVLTVTLLSTITLCAQRPEVKAIDITSASTAKIITIKGSSFGTDATKLAVSFGAAKATVTSIADQLMEVQVPSGATYGDIAVTNTTSRLSGYSNQQFLLSFSGVHPFSTTNLNAQQNFFSEKGLYDLCHCDFDDDGKVDIASANSEDNTISIFRNTSAGSTINFTKIPFSVGAQTLHIRCGDLNGDGKKDLVITDGGIGTSDRVFVLQNTSTGAGVFTFTSQTISLPGRKTTKVHIADLDLDGRPELIITDQGSNNATILVNKTTTAAITFDPTTITMPIPTAASTDGIAVEDLNGDLLPEIVVSQFQTASSNLFIIPNKSIPGTFTFGEIAKITIGNTVKRIRIGDLDGDQKPDITVTQLLGSSISIFLNTGTAGSITFSATPKVVTTDTAPWGLDFGDLDGDGKTDIVVASATQKALSILNNESTPGNLSFVKQSVATSSINRHVRIGDLDGDGKPDISFTSVDNGGVTISNVSVFRNKSCVLPKLDPNTSPLRLCDGLLPFTLKATVSRGANYEWSKDGVAIACGVNQNTLDVTLASGSGKYTVKILAEGAVCNLVPANTCALESAGIDIVIVAGAAATPVPINNGPICLGSNLNLSISAPDAGATYQWTGPAGYTATGANPPAITNFKLENAGVYFVDVVKGTCVQGRGSTTVEVIDVPSFLISVPGSPVICAGDPSKTLTVTPSPALYSYQWLKDGTPVGTGATFTVTSANTSSGNYSVKAIYAGCATVETPAVKIFVATLPVAAFTSSTFSACVGQKVIFTNQSTFDAQAEVFYTWNFGDGNVSTEESPTHIYNAANAGYTPSLMVSYKDGACPNSKSSPTPITVTPATRPVIINPITAGKFDFCEGQSITLAITGTFTNIVWSTGQKDVTSIEVSSSNDYFVDVKDTNGCALTSEVQTVNTIASPDVIVTADPSQINEGETSQLNATGLDSYTWTPPELIEGSATIANPVVRPLITTTFTVTGNASGNECPGIGTIEVKVLGEAIVNKLKPSNMFSPNNSGQNELWMVEEIMNYPQCGVTIYDDKGVKVFSSKPYQNDWDGTFNGKRLPDGVYFYVIRCDGEENTPRTGSITLLR